MRFQQRNRHIIDLVFPIALFFVFASSSLVVLIVAADLYSDTAGRLQINDENRTALSYVAEKIRQSDTNGSMQITEVGGTPCFSISADYNGERYITYIYVYKGMLKELFVRDKTPVSLKDGMDITEVASLSIKKEGTCLYRFTAVDSQGHESSLLMAERSAP